MAVKNKVQLITYPDSLGGDLKALGDVLETRLAGVFQGGVHILPPFPSSGDRGFAPLTYLEIEPSFGDWADIRRIGRTHDVLLDLMVNHLSQKSSWFQDFLHKGRQSPAADLFLTLDKLWTDGEPVQADIDQMFLRRPLPYSSFPVGGDGHVERVWTTFGRTDPSEQIDLDVHAEATRNLLRQFFENFARNGVKIVRLDAVGYVIKKLGTSCFFVEPDIYGFLDWIKDMADSLGIDLLPEIHSHFDIQRRLAGRGFYIYDFILPYAILEALLSKNGANLKAYLADRPSRQFTMLDCHDGIPVKPDLDDRLDTDAARRVVDACVAQGGNLSRILSERHKSADGFDVHQIRCTYASALGGHDDAYLTARALQFFTPGIPQVYYVGLLAGKNDLDAVKATGEGREINRHNYTLSEIDAALGTDAVQRLLRLIRFRNECAAFDGTFTIQPSVDEKVVLTWRRPEEACTLEADLATGVSVIVHERAGEETVRFRV